MHSAEVAGWAAAPGRYTGMCEAQGKFCWPPGHTGVQLAVVSIGFPLVKNNLLNACTYLRWLFSSVSIAGYCTQLLISLSKVSAGHLKMTNFKDGWRKEIVAEQELLVS